VEVSDGGNIVLEFQVASAIGGGERGAMSTHHVKGRGREHARARAEVALAPFNPGCNVLGQGTGTGPAISVER